MPEFYAEPMKDRKCCSVCKKTVKGSKKVLLTCTNCHAITYCGVECQRDDWVRHEWNCVPVMVTEIPGKGRGLVAAIDIKKGELIFRDKPMIKLAANAERSFVDPNFMTSLKQQIDSLPSEARAQFYKLTTRNDAPDYNLTRSDMKVLNLFVSNSKTYMDCFYHMLHLNIALVNHSCAPIQIRFTQIQKDGDKDACADFRAIKNICKGEEITICYFNDVKELGSIPRKRKSVLKKKVGFDCNCPVCLGKVPGQEKIVKKLIDVHNKLNPTTPSDWKREAGLWSRIVVLNMELIDKINIGHPSETINALESVVRFAHLARDKDHVKKAMDMLNSFLEETKLEDMQEAYGIWEMNLAKWSKEFSSDYAPEKEEIDFFLYHYTRI